MQLHFIGKNIDVTDALKSVTTEKLKPLEKRFAAITNVNIVFNVQHKSQLVEANLHFDGHDVHAHAEDEDMYNAIDKLVERLLAQLTKIKEKIIDNHRQA